MVPADVVIDGIWKCFAEQIIHLSDTSFWALRQKNVAFRPKQRGGVEGQV